MSEFNFSNFFKFSVLILLLLLLFIVNSLLFFYHYYLLCQVLYHLLYYFFYCLINTIFSLNILKEFLIIFLNISSEFFVSKLILVLKNLRKSSLIFSISFFNKLKICLYIFSLMQKI